MASIRVTRTRRVRFLVLGLVIASGATPAGAVTIAVDLDATTAAVESARTIGLGESVSVAIRIFDVTSGTPLNAFELDLGFDPAVATPQAAAAGTFLSSPVFEVERVLDPPSMGLAYATLGPGGADGDGVLLLVTILGSGLGTSPLALANVLLSAPFGEEIVFEALFDAELRVVPEPGTAFLLALGLAGVARTRGRSRRA
jgi:hypothetical protein